MDLSFTPDQDALREATTRLYAKESHGERVREVEATGFDPVLWDAVVAMGLPSMALPEASGGAGGSLTDAAAAVEVHGAHLGSVPLVETIVASRLLAAVPQAAHVLDEVVEGPQVVTLALHPAEPGVARMVPGAGVAHVVVALVGDQLVTASDEAVTALRTMSNVAAGDVDLDGATVLAEGEAAQAAYARAIDEWRALTAVAQAGLARATFEVGLQYAKDRHQFGVPIGSFQVLQHRFADLHTRIDGARLLAYEAVWALDEDERTAPMLAAQASWWCGLVAEEAAGFSLHVHGGYGFMLEYDVQLHVRRAKALRLVLGDPRHELEEIAQRRWGASAPAGDVDSVAKPTRAGMDFRFDPETEDFRRQVRAFIDEHLTDDIVEEALATGTMHSWDLHRALCERGYLAAGWPVEVGGLGRSAIDQCLLAQELYASGAPIDSLSIAAMVGATLLVCGTEQQQRDIVPRILAGEVLCCLGYSEPDAGSDVAAVATRAVRDGDDWVIDGQKMFTTMAHEAQYVFLLTRTDPDVPKHKGLTMFLVPMDTPGIEVTPVHTLGGERTNITFYSSVRVPDSARVGDEGAGWSVMHAALVYERASANWGEPHHLVESVAAWARRAGPDGRRPFDDPAVRATLARATTELEVGRLLLFRTAWLSSLGHMPQVEGSMAQLFVPEAFVRISAELLDLLGADGLRPRSAPGTILRGLVEHAFRHSVVTTIYGGTSEVQREIIAGRALGLPKSR